MEFVSFQLLKPQLMYEPSTAGHHPPTELYIYWESPLSWPWTQYIINLEAENDPTDKHSYSSSLMYYTATGLKGSETYRVTVQAVNVYTGVDLVGEPSLPGSGNTGKSQ